MSPPPLRLPFRQRYAATLAAIALSLIINATMRHFFFRYYA